jgi:SAM-dependent methyltransferase
MWQMELIPVNPAQRQANASARKLLERALPLLCCPGCGLGPLSLSRADPVSVFCSSCGLAYPFRKGILNLYVGPEVFIPAQRRLQGRLSTCLYDHFRRLLGRALVGCSVEEEVERFARVLRLKAGDVLVDLACGPARFTIPLARRCSPGLVIGLDISPTQLARAAANVARARLDNVLLVRGDVHRLPLRDGCVARVNCAGRLHQFPQPHKALAEVARILAPGGRLSGSTFARHPSRWVQRLQKWSSARWKLHWFDLTCLQGLVESAGLQHYQGEHAPIPWFGYYQAERA